METLVQLDPAVVLADDNSRFNLKKLRVDSLASNILETNGVLQPVVVEKLAKAENGHTYRLVAGFYRHAAVTKLNAEQGAGLKLPAIVREGVDDLTRLRQQVSENLERENMSPMDQAIAADRLLKAGVSRVEVRRILSRPTGKKGLAMQPISNAMLNIQLRFLELPKAIQERIHDGRVGVAAAYELGKVPPDKRQAVLDRAESDRIGQIEREEKDEERYLLAEKKLTEAQAKEKEALAKVDTAKDEIVKAGKLVAERKTALKEIQKAPGFLEMTDEEKKAVTEKMKAATADVKASEKLEKDAKNALAKLLGQASSAAEVAEEQKAKLEAARKAVKPTKATKGKGKGDAVGPDEVKRAAKAEGVENTGHIRLSLAEIRQCIQEVRSAKAFPKVAAIGQLFNEAIDGARWPKDLIEQLAVLTGEAPPKKAPKLTAATAPAASA